MNTPLRVLCVDDDPDMRRWLDVVLAADPGCTVQLCASPREALAARDFGADLVILDVVLPEMDGPELFAALRAGGISAPVVFVTANNDPRHLERLAALGAADVMVKPLDPENLITRLRRSAGQASRFSGR